MFDMHTHILPHLDDGAKDMKTALDMLHIAVDHGSTHLVVTPHVIEGDWLPAWEEIVLGCETLRKIAKTEKLTISIYPGAEVAIHLDILQSISSPGQYCINGGRYMLVELPAFQIPVFTDEFFFTLQTRGVTPILAHPERHPEIARHPEMLREWIKKGILVQVNTSSLTGRMGERVMETAEFLIYNNMVHCIGSDAHGVRSRRPILTKAYEKVTTLVGEKLARQIFVENADNILQNREVDIPDIGDLKQQKQTNSLRKWLGRLWR